MKIRKGFTLLELIVVVVIIGILASLAVANFIKVAERARASEGKHVLGEIRNASMRYYATTNSYPAAGVYTVLDVSFPGFKFFADPSLDGSGGATIARSDSTYTLAINAAGTITCTGASCADAGCATGTCEN